MFKNFILQFFNMVGLLETTIAGTKNALRGYTETSK